MIDEKILLKFMDKERYETVGIEYDKGFDDAINALVNFINNMPKTDPIIIKPDDEEIRNNLRDLEFERDFYKLHFEELLQRKVEG